MAPLQMFGIVTIKLLATIIGTTGGLFGTIQFGNYLVPKPPANRQVTYKIAAAIDASNDMSPISPGRTLREAGGDVPDIDVWNEVGDYLGSSWGGGSKVPNGEMREITVNLETGHQPSYAVFTAGDDAVCIAYIISAFSDGQAFAWVGDWAADCGGQWYHSGINLDGQELKCAWIDKNGDKRIQGLQIHFPSFHPEVAKDKGRDYYCKNYRILQFFTDTPYFFWNNKLRQRSMGGEMSSSDNSTRAANIDEEAIDTQPDSPENDVGGSGLGKYYANDTKLIRSSREAQSAVELCESPYSRGPDFLSVPEGKLCDMVSRTLWPLCVIDSNLDCFDQEAMEIRVTPASGVRARDLGAGDVLKHYTEVVDWV